MLYLNDVQVEQDRFPDGSLHLRPRDFSIKTFKTSEIVWLYDNDSELFSLISLVDWVRASARNKTLELFLPYVPHARMDRVKTTEDVFTLKSFCKIINSLDFSHVTAIDVHSNISSALLDNFNSIVPSLYISKVIELSNADMLFFPDEGSVKRYSSLNLQLPSTFGIKKRDWETGKIEGLMLADPKAVRGKRVLITDDICSYGGTFAKAAEALRAAGATEVYLYVSHCEPNIEKGRLYSEPGLIGHIYTTDTLLKHPLPNMTFVHTFRKEML